MDSKLLSFAIILLLAGVFHVATTSIGIQCSNEYPKYKDDHPNNGGFLISQLVSAIFVTLIASIGVYLAVSAGGDKVSIPGLKTQ